MAEVKRTHHPTASERESYDICASFARREREDRAAGLPDSLTPADAADWRNHSLAVLTAISRGVRFAPALSKATAQQEGR